MQKFAIHSFKIYKPKPQAYIIYIYVYMYRKKPYTIHIRQKKRVSIYRVYPRIFILLFLFFFFLLCSH